ncbi:MAG TPA: hypothetical protein VHB27_21825 [Rhodopila sp.]|uniref:hypothetical protein n=1 Tax=Rhodopila sp. TaxID=2480087 RepID=UPI002B9166DC|nr:hypothetical protein [Rhodopila sp.]HVY17873.1 hypothetical protein [Rhodopila sp.]
MVTYKIEHGSSDIPGRWVIYALCGNHLQWVVGHYKDRQRAQDRLDRMLKVAEAETVDADLV